MHLAETAKELIVKVKAASECKLKPRSLPGIIVRPEKRAAPSAGSAAKVIAIGISTGGPQALRYLLPQLAADFPAPLVMVLHMPTGYTALFAQKLDEISRLRVKEASEGCLVQRGEALLAPAGRHLSFQRNAKGQVTTKLSIQPLNKPHRPSVDVLFESAAKVYGARVLGVVMTGMGDDGKKGAAWIKAQGGCILTESEESCTIYGMPRSVVEAGLSDAPVPLTSMAEEISKRL
jgi:two-component system chemotaxis response regulator CheB